MSRAIVASQLLRMFETEKATGDILEGYFHGDVERKKEKEKKKSSLLGVLAGTSATIAATITGFLVTSNSGPDGKEVPSALDKGTDWVKDQFKSEEEKGQEKKAIGTQVGPSPLATPEEPSRSSRARPSEDVRSAIKSYAGEVDYSLMYAVAGAESSFRQDVSASTSSAVGLFQFTESTWKYLCSQYKLDYSAQDRNDPRKSAQVASLYLRDINATLQKGLGRKPSYGEVYMGYFLGPTGALRFLKATEKNPDAIGAELFPKAAKANPNVFYEKGNQSKPMTLRQILAKQEGKILSYAKDADPNSGAQYAEHTATPQNIQVRLASPDSKSAVSVRTSASTAASYAAPSGGSANSARPISQPVPEVTAKYSEKAPDVQSEEVTSNDVGNGQLHLPMKKQQQQQQEYIRGRDGRVYVINS